MEGRGGLVFAAVVAAGCRSPKLTPALSLVLTPPRPPSLLSQLDVQPARAGGWYQVESPSRKVTGVVLVSGVESEAARSRMRIFDYLPALFGGSGGAGSPPAWDLTALRVEFDASHLAAADMRRAQRSAAAGMFEEADIAANASAAAAGDELVDDGHEEGGGVRVVLKVC